MPWPFIPHRLYNRRTDIHAPFGGQQQSGIVTPRGTPAIFIFTGHGAGRVGYSDTWQSDGSLRYTGEGQIGPMQMTGGNKAIRDHAAQGRDLLVFEKSGSGKPVRYVGQFILAGWETETQLDTTGKPRDAIVFALVPAEAAMLAPDPQPIHEAEAEPSLSELRARAMEAASPSQMKGQASRSVYRRSEAVREYVLARADGVCEGCGSAAPFITAAGQPYLEPHHIRRLSDGGPDDPRQVAGICPNCHRRAHYGVDAKTFNATLQQRVASIMA